MTDVKPTTTDAGALVESDEHSLTVGPDGPVLLQDHYLIEQMANFNRERIPRRPAVPADQPHHAERERGHEQAPTRSWTGPDRPVCCL